jgi:DNA repair protein RadD
LLDKLSKKEIQKLIGPDLYGDIEEFLEKLYQDEAEIFKTNKKSSQIKILLSLSQNPRLYTHGFWKDCLARCTEGEMAKLKKHGIDLLLSNQKLVEECLKFEYSKYELPYVEKVDNEGLRPAVKIVNAPVSPFKALKDFQTKIFWEIVDQLKSPRTRFIVQMPTGSGKTRTAMEVVAHHFKNESSKNVVWLAHSIDLVEQAASGFDEVWEHLGTHGIELRIVDGNRHGLGGMGEHPALIISTLQSMGAFRRSDPAGFKIFAQSCSLLVVDEAHMSSAPNYRASIESILEHGSQLMGLTATPGRDANAIESNEELAALYFDKTVRLKSSDGGNVFAYLRKIDVMARTSMETITGSQDRLSTAEIKKFEENLSIPKSVMDRLANEDQRNLEIIAKVLELVESNTDRKVILFACSVKHSKFLTAILNYKGVKAAHVDGETSPLNRKKITNEFRSGELNVLTNYGVLATGFDAPKTDVVFIARPTHSIVLYSQIIGRGLRGPAIGGTEQCLIVNVADNLIGLPDHNDIYDYFDDYYVHKVKQDFS